MLTPRLIYLRCAENRVEDDYDGGLVLLQPTRGQTNDDLVDGRLALSFKHDEPMRDFPVTRDEKAQRFFRVTLEEVAYADLPPDPTGAPAPPTARQLLEQARVAALTEGDAALAEEIGAQLATPAPSA